MQKEKKYQKYLPSKNFTITMSGVLIVIIIFVGLFYSFSGSESFTSSNNTDDTPLKIENQTGAELVQNDSDFDGVYDWEEALWGTDKKNTRTFNDTPDAIYIENKKKGLKIEESVNVGKLTETEKFAREFFTSFTAMNASGEVDQDTINSFSSALGQKIVNPALIDQYTETDVKIDIGESSNSFIEKAKYYENVRDLFNIYREVGIGDELDIVNMGLAQQGAGNSTDPYSKLPVIAEAYQDFASKIMELKVPSELAMYHLQIANSSSNTGISVQNMAQIIRDPLVGLEGLSQYQKYSEDLVNAVIEMETALVEE